MEKEKISEEIKSGNFKLKNKRKGKSDLWTVFAEILNAEVNVLEGWLSCRNCRHVYKHNGKNSSNLNRHKCYIDISCNQEKKKLSTDDKTAAIDILADWIVEDCRPFNAVRGTGFLKMAQFFINLGANNGGNIDINDLLPDPTTISRHIQTKAVEPKENIKDKVQNAVKTNNATVTIDMCTDGFVKRNFLGATFHYLDNNNLKELVLGIKSMDFEKSSGTMIFVLPSIRRLRMLCQSNAEDPQLLVRLKEQILLDINTKIIDHLSIWHSAASFLLPPINNLNEFESINTIKSFCKEQIMLNEFSSPQHNSTTSVSHPVSTAVSKKLEEHEFFFPDLMNDRVGTLEERCDREIELYANDTVKLEENFNVLAWWAQNSERFPLLSKLALSVLAMPASSASSERVFSRAGNLINEKRNRLAPKTVDGVIFLNSYMKNI